MSQQVIPLTNSPNQTFAITLSVDGAPLTLNLTFNYNELANYWVMAVADANNVPLVSNIPLVTGNNPACNILAQFAYLEIGSAFVINQTGTTVVNFPNSLDLGTDFILVWGNTPNNFGFSTPDVGSGFAPTPAVAA